MKEKYSILIYVVCISVVLCSPAHALWTKETIDSDLLGAWCLCVVDIDGDSILDVAATGYLANDVVWYHGPNWTKDTIDDFLWGAMYVCAADLDYDNDWDIIATAQNAHDVVWYENPMWTKTTIDSSCPGAGDMYVGDIDDDNNIDAIVAAYYGHAIVRYEAPTWQKTYIDTSLRGPGSPFIADINADSILDIVAIGVLDSNVVWYEAPTWQKTVVDPYLRGAWAVWANDLDHDSDVDIIATGLYEQAVVWYEAPTWTRHTISQCLYPYYLYVDDFSGDGWEDVVVAEFGGGKIVCYNNPYPSDTIWTSTFIDTSLVNPCFVYAADMDGDTDLDIFAADYSDNSVFWYENPLLGVHENSVTKHLHLPRALEATVYSGPLTLPAGKNCRIFDITGRVVEPDKLRPGIYFIEIDKQITQKVIKIR